MKLRITTHFLTLIMIGALLGMGSCKNRNGEGKTKDGDGPQTGLQVPAELAAKYKEDAHRLAAREYNTTSRNNQPETNLPQERVDFFYDLLTKIYLMAEKDPEIPSIQDIHTFPNPPLHRVMVVLEKDADFSENWIKGQRMTSNLYLNQVMSQNSLRVSDFRESGMGTMGIVSSPKFVNTKDLAYILQNIDGIKIAEPDAIAGDGDNIEWGSEGKNHMALKFSKGAGDCPSGCIHRKYWVFYVQEGNISYMGTRGELPNEGETPEED